ncbi:MAG: hypothetical protein QOD78_745, partial [Chloroflexota bacterium]|nr:hypothetical protein [Chloroflexota bacterium]
NATPRAGAAAGSATVGVAAASVSGAAP